MADANIYIEGYISTWDYYDSCSLKAVRESLAVLAPYDAVNVYINSCGGEVVEGLAIYDFLKTLNVPVTTIANGYCCSIATVIFMAGSSRMIAENASFMVHQISGWQEGTADEMREYADLMDKYRDQVIGIYRQSGQSDEDLLAMMEAETWLTGQETLDKGFATALYSTATNRADLRRRILNTYKPRMQKPGQQSTPQTKQPPMATPAKKEPTVMDKAKNAAQKLMNILQGKPVNLAVALESGTSIYVDTTADTPAVDDKVYSDEAMTTAADDGTYTLESGASVTVVGGVITAITEAATNEATPVDNAELDSLRAENATLKAENAATKKELTDFKSGVNAQMSAINAALGLTHSKDLDLTNNSGKSTVTNARTTTDAPKGAVERKREREQAKGN